MSAEDLDEVELEGREEVVMVRLRMGVCWAKT